MARRTMGPRTAYSTRFTLGFMLSRVSTFPQLESPFTACWDMLSLSRTTRRLPRTERQNNGLKLKWHARLVKFISRYQPSVEETQDNERLHFTSLSWRPLALAPVSDWLRAGAGKRRFLVQAETRTFRSIGPEARDTNRAKWGQIKAI